MEPEERLDGLQYCQDVHLSSSLAFLCMLITTRIRDGKIWCCKSRNMGSCGKLSLPLSGIGEKQRGHSTAETELAALGTRADNRWHFLCTFETFWLCREQRVQNHSAGFVWSKLVFQQTGIRSGVCSVALHLQWLQLNVLQQTAP